VDRLGIRDCVNAGRYEEALQAPFNAAAAELHRAHIRALALHRNAPDIRELINLAKTRLSSETPLEKGRRWIRIGLKEQALDVMTAALETPGEPDDYLLTGQLLEQLWRIEAALAYFEKAVALRGNAGDRLWLGMALEHLNRLDEAKSQYTKAIEMRGFAEDFLARGRLFKKLGDRDKARADLETAYKLGERVTSLLLLQELQIEEGRARLKKVVAAISGFLSVKSGK
jgi:tetratricopeptide (TPR) repeat protein